MTDSGSIPLYIGRKLGDSETAEQIRMNGVTQIRRTDRFPLSPSLAGCYMFFSFHAKPLTRITFINNML